MKENTKIGIFIINYNKLFNNSLNQQGFYIYETLSNIENVVPYILIDGDTKIEKYKTININNLDSVLNLNLIIFIDIINNLDILQKYVENNIKLIFYNCGNKKLVYNEDILFDVHNFKENFYSYTFINEIWSIPNYKIDKNFYEIMYNCNFKSVPYIWNSTFCEKYYDTLKYNIFDNETKYIIIMEPNVQTSKSCLLPLLVCEKLYNDYSYDIRIILLCAPKTESFKNFLKNTNIFNDKKLELYPRINTFAVIKQMSEKKNDCYFLSNQNDNPLNFLHLELFYLGFPLIHNTPNYSNCGYYYDNINKAVENLIYSFENHFKNIKQYKKKVNKILNKYSPNNIKNVNIYKHLINNIINFSIFDSCDSIVVMPTCGFANRLRFIYTLYSISKFYNKKLYIIWKKDETYCNIDFKDVFKKIPDVELLNEQLNNNNTIFFNGIHIKDVIQSKIKKIKFLFFSGSYEYKLPTINTNDFLKNKSKFYSNIIWNPIINKKLNRLLNKHKIKQNNFISIHIRTNRNIDLPDISNNYLCDFNKNSSIKLFQNIINKYKNKRLILFSNDNNIKLDDCNYIHINKNCKTNSIDDIVEFLLLSKSKFIIGSFFSSFSDESSFFNMIPKIIPYNVNNFKDNYHCYNIKCIKNTLILNYDKKFNLI